MSSKENKVQFKAFAATSIDGYIADANGGVDWLFDFPNPDNDDLGYKKFINDIDVVVMGRRTFQSVLSLGHKWHLEVPAYVLTQTLEEVPADLADRVHLIKGTPDLIFSTLSKKGFKNAYIEGGETIRRFLKEDLISSITLTTIPVILGRGVPLFGDFPFRLKFKLRSSKVYCDSIVQNIFVK